MSRRVTRPTCILVIGAHRSGTSAVTRTLGLMGAAEAARLLPANDANPSGYWEAQGIVAAHDRFLQAVGSRWDDPRPLPTRAFGGRAAGLCRAELLAVLRAEFAGRPLFVIKDPRLCRVAPLLLGSLETFGARALVVSPIRAPAEVVRSLEAREGFSRLRCLALWLGGVLEAERLTRGAPRLFVRLDDFRADPVAAAQALADRLGCFSSAAAAASPAIAAFWRRTGPGGDAGIVLPGRSASALAERLYEQLRRAADGSEIPATDMDAAHAAFVRFLRTARYRRSALGDGLRELAGRAARRLGALSS
jgi:hypothetical protein